MRTRNQPAFSRKRYRLRLPARTLALGQHTLLMGVLNVTPDSFSDGGRYLDPAAAIARGLELESTGADILDIGGESTRPGAEPLPAEEEWRRVGPVLEGLRGRLAVPISIDTYKATIAERALDLGAVIVNDISALAYDPALASVVARRRAAVVLMHNRGRSSQMYAEAAYANVADDIARELGARVAAAEAAGIARDLILLDPGIGFAKHAEHSQAALASLPRLAALGFPLVCGPSRKSFLTAGLGDAAPGERIWGTAAAVAASVLLGAHIVRVHDVREMMQVARVADTIAARVNGP